MESWSRVTLGYEFRDSALLEQALTHRSRGGRNNERLEFLGDSVLGFVISDQLYARFPTLQEGKLSRMRAALVRRQTLAALARDLDLGAHLHLGGGELKTGGQERDSILADALEAVIGAVYLDGGIAAARELVHRLFADRLAALDPGAVPKDAKTRLQEYLQKRSFEIPSYRIAEVTGSPHEQRFVVECVVAGLAQPVRGIGSSRRAAEQDAAEQAYEKLVAADG